MKSLLALAVRRPVGVVILALVVLLLGFVAIRQLAVDLLPNVDVPRVSITTQYEGVAPEEIETLITRPIEQTTSTVEGIERITAVSSEGLSRVELQFAWGTELSEALDDVRVAIDRVRVRLPEDADPPSIFKFDLASVPIAFLGVTGQGDPRRLKYLAEEDFSRALERVPGVASVSADGGRDREIRVALDGERLAALGITAEQVATVLARENRTVSAGDVLASGHEVVIRTAGEFETVAEVAGVVVATRDGQPIQVEDIGEVLDTMRRVRSELWIDGDPGIRMRVFKQSGANTVAVADGLRRAIDEVNRQYEGRAKILVLRDNSSHIRASVNAVQTGALSGALLAVLVLLVFLRSVRATLVVATAIPLSIMATFGLMFLRGMTLNIISFGGLALGVGMLVDAAIVILENIYRKRDEGSAASVAAVEGGSQVAGAVAAGTVTTVVVFAPVIFIGGFAAVFFGELAMVVTFALLCSLVTALTVVPMLAARWLGRPSRPIRSGPLGAAVRKLERGFDGLERRYVRLLDAVLAAPWAVIVGAITLLAASLLLVPRVGTELMPESDEGRIQISLELAVGTPLPVTTEVMRDVERKVLGSLRVGEIEHVMTSAGPASWWRPGGSHEGELDLMLVPRTARDRGLAEVETGIWRALRDVPGARIRVQQATTNLLTRILRRGDSRLTVEIRGHDLATADVLGARVVELLQGTAGVTYARPNRQLAQLERVLHVDRERAAELGLGSADVAAAVETYLLGRVATRYREAGDEFDIRVQLAEDQRERLDQLPTLPIVTPTGQRVTLDALVTVVERRGPSSISRIDQERVLEINAGVAGDVPLGALSAEVERRLGQIARPDGFSLALGGESAEQKGAAGDLLVGILLAIFLVYAAMAVQFESARDPLIVMLAVPFAFIGVIAVLILTGTTLNLYSALGVIVLIGIVVNNAIVLVDVTNQLRRNGGLALRAAVIEGGRRRLRPILMTTATTACGLLPLALGIGEGSEMQAPLARVVVGGLLSSTLVTLLLVPSAYLLAERRGEARGGDEPDAVPPEPRPLQTQ